MMVSYRLASFHRVAAVYCLASQLISSQVAGAKAFHFKVFLLRHGQTDANEAGVIQGSGDFSKLTDLGRKQAQEVYGAITSDAKDFRLTSVYCSPLTRTRQTLAELRAVDNKRPKHARKLPIEETILANLREIDFYDWQGKSKSELQFAYPESYNAWKAGNPQGLVVFDTSNIEKEPVLHYPLLELWDRADQVWDEIFALEKKCAEKNRAALIVAHGSLGQALLGSAMGWGADRFRQHEFPNCGMIELNFSDYKKRPKTADRWRWIWPTPSAKWNYPIKVMETCPTSPEPPQ